VFATYGLAIVAALYPISLIAMAIMAERRKK
jgi:hypothetical protein